MRLLVLKANYFAVCGAGRLLETMLLHLDPARIEPVLVEVATEGLPSSVHFASERLRDRRHERIVWNGARRAGPAIAALRRLVRETNAEVVWSHDMRCDLLCRLAGGRRGLGATWVAHVHGYAGSAGDLRLRLFEFVDRLCTRSADAVFVGSEHCRSDVARFLPRSVPLRCFPNTVDPLVTDGAEERAPRASAALDLPSGALAVGMHARLHRGKGHADLAEAVLRCRNPAVHAVLLGQGEEEGRLRALAASGRARGRIHVAGPQSQADLLASVAALDVYAFASRRESLPLAVLEAMHLGRPVIATAVGDLPQVLADGTGVLVPPRDPAALARAIDALCADATLRAQLGSRARDVARTRYSPALLGLSLTEALSTIAGARS